MFDAGGRNVTNIEGTDGIDEINKRHLNDVKRYITEELYKIVKILNLRTHQMKVESHKKHESVKMVDDSTCFGQLIGQLDNARSSEEEGAWRSHEALYPMFYRQLSIVQWTESSCMSQVTYFVAKEKNSTRDCHALNVV